MISLSVNDSFPKGQSITHRLSPRCTVQLPAISILVVGTSGWPDDHFEEPGIGRSRIQAIRRRARPARARLTSVLSKKKKPGEVVMASAEPKPDFDRRWAVLGSNQ
jgi:hypothetical protein